MSTLKDHEVKKILAFIQKAHSVLSLPQLRKTILDEVYHLIPYESSGLFIMNTRTDALYWSETVHNNGWFEAYPEFQEFDFTLDKHRKKKTSIVKISEYLPGLNHEGRLFYNEYVKKYKIEHGMEGGTTGDDGLFHGLTLMRPARKDSCLNCSCPIFKPPFPTRIPWHNAEQH